MYQNMTDEELKQAMERINKPKEVAKKLNQRVKDLLSWVGYILSGIGAIGYIVTIFTLVLGAGNLEFEFWGKDGVFFAIGLAFGLFIRTGFYIQGVVYAKQEFEDIIKSYYDAKMVGTKEKKTQSFEFKMTLEITISTVFQIIVFFIGGMGLVYLAGFEGIKNGVYIGNAFSNLSMFLGFGFLALNSSYEKFVMLKIPVYKERTRKLLEEKELKRLAKIEQDRIQQEVDQLKNYEPPTLEFIPN